MPFTPISGFILGLDWFLILSPLGFPVLLGFCFFDFGNRDARSYNNGLVSLCGCCNHKEVICWGNFSFKLKGCHDFGQSFVFGAERAFKVEIVV